MSAWLITTGCVAMFWSGVVLGMLLERSRENDRRIRERFAATQRMLAEQQARRDWKERFYDARHTAHLN